MNIYIEREFFNHIDPVIIKKMTNCPFTLRYVESDELVENSLFISTGVFWGFDPTSDLLEKLKNLKNKKLLIFHHSKSLSECVVDSIDIVKNFKEFIDEFEFNYENVFIITQLQYDIKTIQKILPNVNVLSYDRWMYEFIDFDLLQTSFAPLEYVQTINHLPNKKFSIFCKRYTKHRLEIFCNLISNELLENFNYTFVAERLSDTSKAVNDISDKFESVKNNILEWLQGVPYDLKIRVNEQYVYQHPHYPYELKHYFDRSYIHVSLESEPTASSFLTEKTIRAIFYKKPFIIISQYNALKALRAEGYKTFSPMIDESYDDIEDYEGRLYAIIREIKRLNELPEQELQNLVNSCEQIVEHNYKVFYENAIKPFPEQFKFKSLLTFS